MTLTDAAASRLCGLMLLLASPLVAAWACWVLRNSGIPEDRSYFCNLREIAAAAVMILKEGFVFDEE